MRPTNTRPFAGLRALQLDLFLWHILFAGNVRVHLLWIFLAELWARDEGFRIKGPFCDPVFGAHFTIVVYIVTHSRKISRCFNSYADAPLPHLLYFGHIASSRDHLLVSGLL